MFSFFQVVLRVFKEEAMISGYSDQVFCILKNFKQTEMLDVLSLVLL